MGSLIKGIAKKKTLFRPQIGQALAEQLPKQIFQALTGKFKSKVEGSSLILVQQDIEINPFGPSSNLLLRYFKSGISRVEDCQRNCKGGRLITNDFLRGNVIQVAILKGECDASSRI